MDHWTHGRGHVFSLPFFCISIFQRWSRIPGAIGCRRSVWKCTYHAVALLTDRWHTASTYSPLFYMKRSTVDINYWGTASQTFLWGRKFSMSCSVCHVAFRFLVWRTSHIQTFQQSIAKLMRSMCVNWQLEIRRKKCWKNSRIFWVISVTVSHSCHSGHWSARFKTLELETLKKVFLFCWVFSWSLVQLGRVVVFKKRNPHL